MRSFFLLSAFAALVSASAHAPPSSAAAGFSKHRRLARAAKSWTLESFNTGEDFLNLFEYGTGSDNGGVANYVSESQAKAEDLVWVNPKDKTVHLRVSPSEAVTSSRNTIKLVSKAVHNQGLFIFDIERQPQVCGVWPAVWMTSLTQSWPEGGEIDIVEYVSRQTDNAFSVHTAPGCYAGETGYSAKTMLAGQHALNCDAHATNAQGCGFRSSQNVSAGIGANWDKGGVYALSWADDGIKAWFFPRKSVPADLAKRQPVPTSWRKPDMFISPNTCNPNTYFKDLGIVINTNLGGTWAEGVWSHDNSYAGQIDGSCASQTGFSTAAEYVLQRGRDFKHAYWKFRSLAIYK